MFPKLGLYQKPPMKNLLKPRTEIYFFGLYSNYIVKDFFAGATVFDLLFRKGSVSTLRFLFSTSQFFSNCFCTHILCKCFEFFFTFTYNFPNLWGSKSFCSWNYITFNEGDCNFPNAPNLFHLALHILEK